MTKNNMDSSGLDSLNTLAAGLVHEIKNPLNAISINLQLLNEDLQNSNIEKDSKMSRRVRLLQNEVNRLDSILSDFLRFAKRHELHLEACDINEVIDSVLDFISPEAMQNSIRILKSYDTKLPKCNLDSNVIKQALLNVLRRIKRMDLYPKMVGNLLYTVKTENEWKKDEGKSDDKKESGLNRVQTIAKKLTAVPMAVHDIDQKDMDKVLALMMVDASAQGRPLLFRYLANQSDSSNKFHAFAIFKQRGSGQFVAMNAYGRIGYPPRFHYLGKYDDKSEAMAEIVKKVNKKSREGYEEIEI